MDETTQGICPICNGSGVQIMPIAWLNEDGSVGEDVKSITCTGCNGSGGQLRDDLVRVNGLSPALLAQPADINRAQSEQLSEMYRRLLRRQPQRRQSGQPELSDTRTGSVLTPEYCYVCSVTLTPESTRIAQIDGGETIIRICDRDDCADDERIHKLIGSAADHERWLHEQWMVEHGGPDFDFD